MDFCHLHTHTQYSLLDGHSEIETLVKRAKELGQTSVAITDHGSLYGIIDFYKTCKKNDIKPILGSEFYLCENAYEHSKGYTHLVLLAKNETGLKNLYKLSSFSFTDGFYSKPRIDKNILKNHSEGIICLTGCLNGKIPKMLSENNTDGAYREANSLIEIFGKDDLYIEIQYHKIPEEARIVPKLAKLGDDLGLSCVITNDIHYVYKEDSLYQDVLMCVSMQKQFDDPDRLKFETDEFYMKSYKEMEEVFYHLLPDDKITSYLDNSLKISEKCNVEIKFHNFSFPKFFDNKTEEETEIYFRNLCRKGLSMRYETVTEEMKSRLEYEMDTICEMGFCDYFLIVWDFVRFAKTNNIPVGPGRGSAAGSLVSYVLNITTVDPVKYNLVFERFLNKQRVSMPDIDIDFCNERRDEVIEYVIKKYGKSRVCRILTFGTLKAKAAIKDVARVLGIPYFKADEVSKMIPHALKITIDEVLKTNKKLLTLYENDNEIKRLLDISRKIEGHLRHGSVHAAGVLITGEPSENLVPLTVISGATATQFEMGTLEELGLLKMDFLGLRNLSVIKNTINDIENACGVKIDFSKDGYENPDVYRLISSGNTDGIFQLESGGMKRFLQELKPKTPEDIVAAIALYRPGPMSKIPEFIKNKNNPRSISYKCPQLKDILDVTYGCIVYQEQVMEIFRKLAGYSYGDADIVRKAISKKKADVLSEQRERFINGCNENGISPQISSAIFSDIEAFADYAFNKSHSVCYAMIAYETAYLKCKFPAYFYASIISSFMDFTEKVAFYIGSAENMGIKTLPPKINTSDVLFKADKNTILFGLAAIKGIGKNMAELIVKEREEKGDFLSLDDFLERMVKHKINKGAIESLIKAGCFEGFGKRLNMLHNYDTSLNSISSRIRNNSEGQLSFTDMIKASEPVKKSLYDESMIEAPTKAELEMEREVLGLYLSGHPLKEYLSLIKQTTKHEILSVKEQLFSSEIIPSELKNEITFVGVINNLAIKRTKAGKDMALFTLEDISSTCECVVFPAVYTMCEPFIAEGEIVVVQGRIDIENEDSLKFSVTKISEFSKTPPKSKLYLRISNGNRQKLTKIKTLLKAHHGNIPVFIYYPEENKTLSVPNEYKINENDLLINELKILLSEENVKMVEI